MTEYPKFEDLKGKTITEIIGGSKGSDDMRFKTLDGKEYRLFHWQDCCEGVSIEDIIGDLDDLLNTPIVMAEEVSNVDEPSIYESADSYTWTFYKLATLKGYVTIRWYGESNGYYSEGVDFEEIVDN